MPGIETAPAGSRDAMSSEAIYRLMSWLSPASPVGGFSYSHGLEKAVEAGLVQDRSSLVAWLEGIIAHGGGRTDAILLVQGWHAVHAGDQAAFKELCELARLLPASLELALETEAQGRAFAATAEAAWGLDPRWSASGDQGATPPAYPLAVASLAVQTGIPLEILLPAWLQAFAGNLVSAAVRLVPLGQTDGQRAIAALEPCCRKAAADALTAGIDTLGSACLMTDWCSMAHETQGTRLFRS